VSTATSLSFDIRDLLACGSAPMFRIVTPDNVNHDFACQSGSLTLLPSGWTHVSFAPVNYDNLAVSRLFLRYALPTGSTGSVTVDDVEVNGAVFDH